MARRESRAPYTDPKDVIAGLLAAYFTAGDDAPERLHAELSRPGLSSIGRVEGAALFPLPDGVDPAPERLRRAGMWLVRNGTDRRAVLVGLLLLEATARRADIPVLRMMGLLPDFTESVVRTIAGITGTTADLVWLAERAGAERRGYVIRALVDRADPMARRWLLRNALSDFGPGGNEFALRIAEVTRLADALVAVDRDDRLRDQAIGLMLRMTRHDDYGTVIDRYRDARRVFALIAAETTWMAPTSERCAELAAVVEELRTGASACLDWARGEREEILERLLVVLRSPAWTRTLDEAERDAGSETSYSGWRARWARAVLAIGHDGTMAGAIGNPLRRFEIRITLPIPPRSGVFGGVETRVLIDGRPIIADLFHQGAAEPPEKLLLRGELRATEEPRRVRLAEAWCTEGCCGGLYVTIVREGDEVVWRDWERQSGAGLAEEFRFAAPEYDREIARAEADHGWEWPARTLARLVNAAVLEDPTILGRWNCSVDWIGAVLGEYDVARIWLLDDSGEYSDQFGYGLHAEVEDLEGQARSVIEAFRVAHPRKMLEYQRSRLE
ncbi:hypothetical protein ACFVUS_00130 [Nocardia sp. NPDC058058]|uniref:hypothetical protein n=1 Tax=Nocardia sp. NPDC058058 TaxID=3346317 RepID=UPI0036DAA89E